MSNILTSFLIELFYYCHYGHQIQYQVRLINNTSYFIYYIGKLHYFNQIKITVLFIYLQFQSSELFQAMYDSNWYKMKCRCHTQNKKHQLDFCKSAMIIMERTKRPITVTTGKLLKLNYETFISVSY